MVDSFGNGLIIKVDIGGHECSLIFYKINKVYMRPPNKHLKHVAKQIVKQKLGPMSGSISQVNIS